MTEDEFSVSREVLELADKCEAAADAAIVALELEGDAEWAEQVAEVGREAARRHFHQVAFRGMFETIVEKLLASGHLVPAMQIETLIAEHTGKGEH